MKQRALQLLVVVVLGLGLADYQPFTATAAPVTKDNDRKNVLKQQLGLSQDVKYTQQLLRRKHPERADWILDTLNNTYKALLAMLEEVKADKWVLLGRMLSEFNKEKAVGDRVWLKEIHSVKCSCSPEKSQHNCADSLRKHSFIQLLSEEAKFFEQYFCSTSENEARTLRGSGTEQRKSVLDELVLDSTCEADVTVASLRDAESRVIVSVLAPLELVNLSAGMIGKHAHSVLSRVPLKLLSVSIPPIATAASSLTGKRSLSDFNANSVSLSNGTDSLAELFRLGKETECERDDFGICKAGSVNLDKEVPYQSTLKTQRVLQSHLPLNYVNFLHTHNSFNAIGDVWYTEIAFARWLHGFVENITRGNNDSEPVQFVWTQQLYSVTDQLNFGIRGLMFDPRYVFGDLRVCHAGTTIPIFDDIIEVIEEILHIKINFTSNDLGCTPFDKLLGPALQEAKDWIGDKKDITPEKFLTVLLNVEGPEASCGHIPDIQNITETVFDSYAFSPSDKKQCHQDREWPTISTLTAMGKSVMIKATGNTGNDYIFEDMTVPFWPYDTMVYFTDYPECGGYKHGDWAIFGGESMNLPPFFCGQKTYGLVNSENAFSQLACGVSETSFDLVSPALVRATVWTWDNSTLSQQNIASINQKVESYILNYPSLPTQNGDETACASVRAFSPSLSGDAAYGRWFLSDCHQTFPRACWNPENSSVSDPLRQVGGSWNLVTHGNCSSGTYFVPPVTAYQNRILADTMISSNVSVAWLGIPSL